MHDTAIASDIAQSNPGRIFEDLPQEYGFKALRVEGRIPDDLHGTLYRNGPAFFSRWGQPYRHWFDGDGAVSAVRLRNGRAWGAVKWVQTPGFVQERDAGKALYAGFGTPMPGPFWRRLLPRYKNAANTALLVWQDRLYALYEAGLPIRLDPETLATLGETDFDGVLGLNFSAHPHYVPSRRSAYNFAVRYGRYTWLDLFALPHHGPARRLGSLRLHAASMVHDFIATPNYLIFFIPPIQLQTLRQLLGLGTVADNLAWRPALGTEILLVPIDRPAQPIRFQTDAFFQWHFANAYETDAEVLVDFVRYPDFQTNQNIARFFRGKTHAHEKLYAQGRLCRVRLVPAARRVSMDIVDDMPCEFPRIAPGARARTYRFAYLVGESAAHPYEVLDDCLTRWDFQRERATRFQFDAGQFPGEPVFVPKSHAYLEEDGYVLSLVYDARLHRSHLALLDAAHMDAGPMARVHFEHHIPLTLHGIWNND